VHFHWLLAVGCWLLAVVRQSIRFVGLFQEAFASKTSVQPKVCDWQLVIGC